MEAILSLRKILKTKETCIDNGVFRMHYKASVLILIVCSVLVSSQQFIGNPIYCLQVDKIPEPWINQYCWTTTTFTSAAALRKKVGVEVPYPGVDTYVPGKESQPSYHTYYQWVYFILLLQAAMFYFPKYVWTVVEGCKIEKLIQGLDSPVESEESKSVKKVLLVNYFINNLHGHGFYVAVFVLCESANFINVVGQIYFTNWFLNGKFLTYGVEVVRFLLHYPGDRHDPMIAAFPKITKCSFRQFGPSGDIQIHDALCVLPINLINEKSYLFLWFWFTFLAILTGLCIMFRFFVVACPCFRVCLLKMRFCLAQKRCAEVVAKKLSIGDWFVLSLLAKNIDSFIFTEFVVDLAAKLEGVQSMKYECGDGALVSKNCYCKCNGKVMVFEKPLVDSAGLIK